MSWQQQVVACPEGLNIWLRLWPISVDVTNEQTVAQNPASLDIIQPPSGDQKPTDMNMLNTPAGKLVEVFMAACPPLNINPDPFGREGPLQMMRENLVSAPGLSGLIARHRMIKKLEYFLRADPDWARKHLITPLNTNHQDAGVLWRAVARTTRFTSVLRIIGNSMAERATDPQLEGEARRSLVFSLFVECLHAYREGRDPAVSYHRIQQMIRSLDDESRAYGAKAIVLFVGTKSFANEPGTLAKSPEALFRSAATPFLEHVWPQERSLATSGVSHALAGLPATSQEAFAECGEARPCGRI